MTKRFVVPIALTLLFPGVAWAEKPFSLPAPVVGRDETGTRSPAETALRFEITMARGLLDAPQDGRLLVVLGRSEKPEPRRTLGQSGLDAPPVLGRDAVKFAPERILVIDGTAVSFPIADLTHLPPGDYWAQALFNYNRDLILTDAPGTLYSKPRRVHLDPTQGQAIALELTEKLPAESVPAASGRRKFVKLRSQLLSQFHGRDIFLRAGLILPTNFAREPMRRYPLRVHIGGYGSRYFLLPRENAVGDDMVVLMLDGAGPYGDPYQVNSENNGPYGDALIRELIPHIEQQYRCIGKSYARVLSGGSTGGWVSLALQVFYPDYFNGTWSSCPDPVDFRSFQLINIYQDTNAYVNKHGFERPGKRDTDGDVNETMRHQCQLENVLGRGNSWTTSGQQWGAWNAVFSPRGPDGLPVPLWDPRTGVIDRKAAEHWKRYDLRLVLQENWKTLGPKLRGKLQIWVGDADNYFLNNAVHQLDAFLSKTNPPYDGTIAYGPLKGHCWRGVTEQQMTEQMLTAIRKSQEE